MKNHAGRCFLFPLERGLGGGGPTKTDILRYKSRKPGKKWTIHKISAKFPVLTVLFSDLPLWIIEKNTRQKWKNAARSRTLPNPRTTAVLETCQKTQKKLAKSHLSKKVTCCIIISINLAVLSFGQGHVSYAEREGPWQGWEPGKR